MLLVVWFACGIGTASAAPLAATDSDGDGLPDAWEIAAGINPAASDSDGDGYDDASEIAAGYDPLLPAPAILSDPLRTLDTDGDALRDYDEIRWGTTLMERDTDGDGYADGAEIASGYDPKNPAPTRLTKRIEIVIAAQELRPFLGPYDLGVHPVSTGRQARPTPKGTFRIAAKNPRAWSSLAMLWMPWWMNFTGPGAPAGRYGIHELPEWPNGTKEGVAHLGTPVSGGCIRLGPDVASTIYRWADIGTTVVVR